MRSLSTSTTRQWAFHNARLTHVAIDVELDTLYVTSEQQHPDADVDITIFKVDRNIANESTPSPLVSFTTSSHTSSALSQILSVHFLPETRAVALLTCGGDIGVVSLSEDAKIEFEVVGSIDVGIKNAAWSPDDTLVVIITGEDKLLVMTNTFDVLSEAPLLTSDRGEDLPVNVGWGSKQTQFHGSLGKAAAQSPNIPQSIGDSPDDDTQPRIGWRGDGALFVVSSLDAGGPRRRRVLRVYDRQGALQTTSEAVAGLEHTLCWRPSGNLIVSTQRFGFDGCGAGKKDRHDVVFFEKNGLRHGEFRLRETRQEGAEGRCGYRVKEVFWNCDSSILAVWIERDEGDLVQLWTTGNYHWYLKQEILAPAFEGFSGRFTSLTWHPEIAMQLFLTTPTCLLERTLAWETFSCRSQPPNDAGLVAVVDGTDILITPFRIQNVPPPMSSHRLSLSESNLPSCAKRTPIHIAFSPTNGALGILYHSGHVEIWDLCTRLHFGRGKAVDPVKSWEGSVASYGDEFEHRQICIWSLAPSPNRWRIACLSSDNTSDVIHILDTDQVTSYGSHQLVMPGSAGRLVYSEQNIVWQSSEGQLFSIDLPSEKVNSIARFPELCFNAECISHDRSEVLFAGLSDAGRLHITSSNSSSRYCLANNCNSFTITSGFVIFTTTSHEAFFAPMSGLHAFLTSGLEDGKDVKESPPLEKRRVERGSRIVIAVPSAMTLVLQMPRGNLETINPRPLVLDVVRRDMDAGSYRKAFLACRRHRIDLNIFVEHDQTAFLEGLPSFIEEIDDVDHFNLFLTGLGQSSLSAPTIATFCDAIRAQLEARNIRRYINSILTAYVVKNPPDYESALSLLLRLRDEDPDMVEEAVRYVVFLVDVDKLFDTALGMYDFALVLMVAQHSQKDPREYLPFLRELRALEKYYQRYKIDDYLRRHQSALRNLSLAGSEHVDGALEYVEKHQLYSEGLSIWKNDPTIYKRVLNIYGDWLFDRREFRHAALAFVRAEKSSKAMLSYERALLWRELFDIALQEHIDTDALTETAYRVAEELSSKKRYADAAQVLLDYAKDVNQSIVTLAHGNQFSEARRLISLHAVPDLVDTILHPAAFDSRSQISEDIEEMRSQLQKQIQRLRELRVKKIEEPDAFYGDEDPNLHNVDVMTDISMATTAFTRYTAAPTNTSRSSKRSSRSKRKMERKVGSGRKGTIDEEEYLVKSIEKLAAHFNGVQGDTENVLCHLMQFSAEHRAEGRALQEDLGSFRNELAEAIEEIWSKAEDPDAPQINTDSWAFRMEEKRRSRQEAIDRITRPEINPVGSRVDLLDN